jgi:hypothetical protein
MRIIQVFLRGLRHPLHRDVSHGGCWLQRYNGRLVYRPTKFLLSRFAYESYVFSSEQNRDGDSAEDDHRDTAYSCQTCSLRVYVSLWGKA